MPEVKIHFLKPGLLTTVQDMGRDGHQSFGVPAGGALDKTAMQTANWLVGNPLNNPVLEMTLLGPKMEMEGISQIVFTGADMSPKINGLEVPLFKSIKIENKAEITFGRLKNGCRCYMAVAGEWQVKKWMGSCSTAPNQLEGLTPDSFIKKGSVLKIKTESTNTVGTFGLPDQLPTKAQTEIRVLPGPEYDLFHPLFIGRFFSTLFKISINSNRMGYRLEGNLNCTENQNEIISSPVLPGTIQITRSGQPIVMLADAQTTGGYPRFANVIAADMDYLAQLKPGDPLRFVLVTMEEALQALVKKNGQFAFLYNAQ